MKTTKETSKYQDTKVDLEAMSRELLAYSDNNLTSIKDSAYLVALKRMIKLQRSKVSLWDWASQFCTILQIPSLEAHMSTKKAVVWILAKKLKDNDNKD